MERDINSMLKQAHQACKASNHHLVKKLLPNLPYGPSTFISMLRRSCKECISLFLEHVNYKEHIFTYCMDNPEIPMDLIVAYAENHKEDLLPTLRHAITEQNVRLYKFVSRMSRSDMGTLLKQALNGDRVAPEEIFELLLERDEEGCRKFLWTAVLEIETETVRTLLEFRAWKELCDPFRKGEHLFFVLVNELVEGPKNTTETSMPLPTDQISALDRHRRILAYLITLPQPKKARRVADYEEMFEILFPLAIGGDAIELYGFPKLFDLLAFAIEHNVIGLSDACLNTFYGAEANSLNDLLLKCMDKFHLDSIEFGTTVKTFTGRLFCLLLHDRIDEVPDDRFNSIYYNSIRYIWRRINVFDTDNSLELVFLLLEASQHHDTLSRFVPLFLTDFDHFTEAKALQYRRVISRIYATRPLTFLPEMIHLVLQQCKYLVQDAVHTGVLQVWISFCFPPTRLNQIALNKEFVDHTIANNQFELCREFLSKELVRSSAPNVQVPSLKHLCRLRIREDLEANGLDSMEFQEWIKNCRLPPILKRYIRFLDKVIFIGI